MTEVNDASLRIERILSDFRESMARQLGELTATVRPYGERLDAHDRRIQKLEREMLTREECAQIVAQAINLSRRLSWKDLAALTAAGSTAGTIAVMIHHNW